MCRRHWYMVPAEIRRGVWRCYRPGQEIRKRISPAYLQSVRAAMRAVAEKERLAPPAAAAELAEGCACLT
jgi:hypothetical protein